MRNAIWLFVFATVILIVFIPSYTRMQELRGRNTDYKNQITHLVKKNAELRREVTRLKEDPVYLEKVAREKMGLIREGEMIYAIGVDAQEEE